MVLCVVTHLRGILISWDTIPPNTLGKNQSKRSHDRSNENLSWKKSASRLMCITPAHPSKGSVKVTWKELGWAASRKSYGVMTRIFPQTESLRQENAPAELTSSGLQGKEDIFLSLLFILIFIFYLFCLFIFSPPASKAQQEAEKFEFRAIIFSY